MKQQLILLVSRLFLVSLVSFMLSGCFIRPYKFDLQQGNTLTPEKIATIHPGMSEEQVRYVLGTPLLQDPFHANRWDYIYLEKPGARDKKEIEKRLIVFFDQGKVMRVLT